MEEKFDYKELGLKSGLEIHQQLDTKKLFCDCPSILRNDVPEWKKHNIKKLFNRFF